MNIRFYQKDGRVGVKFQLTCEEIDKCPKRPYPAFNPFLKEIDIGLLPMKIQGAGKKSIREYAERAWK